MVSPAGSSPTVRGVPPYGPSSMRLTRLPSSNLPAIELAWENPCGLRRRDVKHARSWGDSSGLSLRATTRHSAIPVSEEKDISRPFAAMLKTVTSVYSLEIISRNFALPGLPVSHRQGEHQGEDAAGLDLPVGQVLQKQRRCLRCRDSRCCPPDRFTRLCHCGLGRRR